MANSTEQLDIPYGKTFQDCQLLFGNFLVMFGEAIDADVIKTVLDNRNWNVELAAEDLLRLRSNMDDKPNTNAVTSSDQLEPEQLSNYNAVNHDRSWNNNNNDVSSVVKNDGKSHKKDIVLSDDDDADVIIEEVKEVVLSDDNAKEYFPYNTFSSIPFVPMSSSCYTGSSEMADRSLPNIYRSGQHRSNESLNRLDSTSDGRLPDVIFLNNYKSAVEIRNVFDRVCSLAVNGIKVMVLLRGVPGSGKSFTADSLMKTLTKTKVFDYQFKYSRHVHSTDDFFMSKYGYDFDHSKLSDAHNWNQKRVNEAVKKGISPVIIDNTNTQLWEMLPYVKMAAEQGYRLEVIEPNTRWKFDELALLKRNVHNVPRRQIKLMLERFEVRNITGKKLMETLNIRYHPSMKPPQPVPDVNVNKEKHSRKKNRNRNRRNESTVSSSFIDANEDTEVTKSSEPDIFEDDSILSVNDIQSVVTKILSRSDNDGLTNKVYTEDQQACTSTDKNNTTLSSNDNGAIKSNLKLCNDNTNTDNEVLFKNYKAALNAESNFSRIIALILHKVRVLVMLRGCPGSGKTYAARQLIDKVNESKMFTVQLKYCNHIFGADDFFTSDNLSYDFDRLKLSEAHLVNQKRVREAMESHFSPVIIDNCNAEILEMKPYSEIAVKYGYHIEVLEPDTAWKFDEIELTKRNIHSISRIKIRYMLDRFVSDITPDILLTSFNLDYSTDLKPPQPANNEILLKDNNDRLIVDENDIDDVQKPKNDIILAEVVVEPKEILTNCETQIEDTLKLDDKMNASTSEINYVVDNSKNNNARDIVGMSHKVMNEYQSNGIKYVPIYQLIMNEMKNRLDRILVLILSRVNVLVLLRGCYGSGKTYTANSIINKLNELQTYGSPLEYSEHVFNDYIDKNFYLKYDQYFCIVNTQLRKVEDAMKTKRNPIVIDNCNITIEEMKPYVEMAVINGYAIELLEPYTDWKYKPGELLKRASNPFVSLDEIKVCLSMFDRTVTARSLLNIFNLCYTNGGPKIDNESLYLDALKILNSSTNYCKSSLDDESKSDKDSDVLDYKLEYNDIKLPISEIKSISVKDEVVENNIHKNDESILKCQGTNYNYDVIEKGAIPKVLTQNNNIYDKSKDINSVCFNNVDNKFQAVENHSEGNSSINSSKETQPDDNNFKQAEVVLDNSKDKDESPCDSYKFISKPNGQCYIDLDRKNLKSILKNDDNDDVVIGKGAIPKALPQNKNLYDLSEGTNRIRLNKVDNNIQNVESRSEGNTGSSSKEIQLDDYSKQSKVALSKSENDAPCKFVCKPDGVCIIDPDKKNVESLLRKDDVIEKGAIPKVLAQNKNVYEDTNSVCLNEVDNKPEDTKSHSEGNSRRNCYTDTQLDDSNSNQSEVVLNKFENIAPYKFVCKPDGVCVINSDHETYIPLLQKEPSSNSVTINDCGSDMEEDKVNEFSRRWKSWPEKHMPSQKSENHEDSPKPARVYGRRSQNKDGSCNNIFVSSDSESSSKIRKEFLDWSTVSDPCSNWFDRVKDTISGTGDPIQPKPQRSKTNETDANVDKNVSTCSSNNIEQDESLAQNPERDNNKYDPKTAIIGLLKDTDVQESIEESVLINENDSPSSGTCTNVLAHMFPGIASTYVDDLIEQCQGDLNWVAEILFEEQNNECVLSADDLATLQNQASNDVQTAEVDSTTSSNINTENESNVNELIPNSDPSTRKVKKGLFVKSKRKLSNTAVELKKMIEKSVILNPSNYSENVLKLIKKRRCSSNLSRHAEQMDEFPNHQYEDNYTEELVENGELVSISVLRQETEQSSDAPVVEEIGAVADEPVEEIEDVDNDRMLEFVFNKDIISTLHENFGNPGLPSNIHNNNYAVKIPENLARELHSYVMYSIQNHMDEEETLIQEMIIKDEELARRLQEEEETGATGFNYTPNLKEIIDMETALALYQADKDYLQRENSETFAARLGKKILQEKFPNVDQNALLDLYKVNNYSLHDTFVTLINENSSTDLNDWKLQLLEKAKQENAKVTNESTRNDSKSEKCARREAESDFEYFREEAFRHNSERIACFNKAKEAYNLGNKNVASYYSQLASLHKQQIEVANANASTALLSLHKRTDAVTLDLHFYQVKEAVQVLDLFIDSAISRLREKQKQKEHLFVITGRGVHSANGKAKLRPVVERRLRVRKIPIFQDNPGMIRLIVTKNTPFSNDL